MIRLCSGVFVCRGLYLTAHFALFLKINLEKSNCGEGLLIPSQGKRCWAGLCTTLQTRPLPQ